MEIIQIFCCWNQKICQEKHNQSKYYQNITSITPLLPLYYPFISSQIYVRSLAGGGYDPIQEIECPIPFDKPPAEPIEMSFYSDSQFSRQFGSFVNEVDHDVLYLGNNKVKYWNIIASVFTRGIFYSIRLKIRKQVKEFFMWIMIVAYNLYF